MRDSGRASLRQIALLWCMIALTVAASSVNSLAVMASASPKAIYQAEKGGKSAALMFNVYQNTENVEEIAEILERYGVRASFFLGGIWAEKNEEVVSNLYARGHDIGNHGYRHKLPAKSGAAVTLEEIRRTDEILSKITGEKPFLYAPPSGDFNQETVDIAFREGYVTILWSADTIDWRDQDSSLILNRAKTKLGEGGFLLMHPTPATVSALPAIIEWLISHGYEVLPVSEMINHAGTEK